jgi:tetratricopeptide (TPR) repeat protein
MPMPERLEVVRQVIDAAPTHPDTERLMAHEPNLLRLLGRPAEGEAVGRHRLSQARTELGRGAILNMVASLRAERDPAAALAMLDEVLELAGPTGQLMVSAHRNRALALESLGRLDEAEAELRAALHDAILRQDPRRVGDVRLQLSQVVWQRDPREAHEHLDEAERAFEATGDEEGQVLVAFTRAGAALEEGRLALAHKGNERHAAWADRLQNRQWQHDARVFTAWVILAGGDAAGALEAFLELQPGRHPMVSLGAAIASMRLEGPAAGLPWLPPRGEGSVMHRAMRALATGDPDDLAAAEAAASSEVDRALVRLVRTGVWDAQIRRLSGWSLNLRLVAQLQGTDT